jgi:large subunit ribosomal protein L7/L12
MLGQRASSAHFSTLSYSKFLSISSPPTLPRRWTNAGGARFLSSDAVAAASATEDEGGSSDGLVILSSEKLQGLYDRVVRLPVEDVNVLGALVLQVLGRKIFPGEFGGSGMAVGGDGAAAAAGGAGVEEVVEAKTIFDLKLVGFDAKAKIKVIKEVRAIAGLGLKEAKELVESAPKVIQKDLKQEKADELKAQLEAVGAEIELV